MQGALLGVTMLLLWGCPQEGVSVDSATPPDAGLVLNEAGLALCGQPGAYCTPADPCGLNPRCSAEGVCITVGSRDCDDGISCTEDRCVHGGCAHEVMAGYCLIDDACHQKGATVGCGRCLPGADKAGWSPLGGVSCDDRNPCTKGDECKQGMCVGQPYTCTDKLSCTTNSCDGLGGCKSLLLAQYCLIEQACYSNGESDPSNCRVCDVTVSQYSWQDRANVCNIDSKCHVAGTKDTTGCFTCEPLHAPNSWTPLPDTCLVSQICLQKGSTHPSGCASCDPTQSTSQWTPAAGAGLSTETFDNSLGGYTTSPPTGTVGWQLSTSRFTSAPASLYYGDLATQSYDSGTANSGGATTPPLKLPGGQKAFLSFQLYMDTETSSTFDLLEVLVEGQVLWSKATGMQTTDYRRWVSVTVELSSFAGKTVQVVFLFDTKDDLNNQSEGVYLDDVTVMTGCGAV